MKSLTRPVCSATREADVVFADGSGLRLGQHQREQAGKTRVELLAPQPVAARPRVSDISACLDEARRRGIADLLIAYPGW